MRRRLARVGGLALGLGLLLMDRPAQAVITRLTPLREVLASEQLIFTGKVEKLDPDRPAVVLQVVDDLKGKAPFRKLPINLTADSEGQREGHTPKLLKRLAPDLTLIVFTSKRGKRYTAFAYTNGTWFQLIGHAGDDPAIVRWGFAHCEPYLRRTFKGSTAELRQVVVDGLADKKKPPEPDPKEPPGLGPEVKPDPPKKNSGTGGGGVLGWWVWKVLQNANCKMQICNLHFAICILQFPIASRPHHPTTPPVFAVIPTFVIVGPLALLATLFPAVFGGLALFMRRWLVLLSIASLNSTLYLAHAWFRGYIKDTWLGTAFGLWSTLTLLTLAGIAWSWRRQRAVGLPDPEAAGSRRGEHIILWSLSLTGLAVVLYCLGQGTLFTPPWKELLVIWSVSWMGTLYMLCLRLTTRAMPSTEAIMLWTLAFACAGLGALSLPRSTPGDGVLLVWKFEPKERGAILSSPTLGDDRVYVAAIQGSGFSTYGVVYCLDRETGEEIWRFDDDGAMQQVFSSPCLYAGRLYIGEGLHENRGCKFYCLDAATGQKLWHFETASHTESSPCAANGKVYLGAGEDGIYCLDAATGAEQWHFQENLHVDASPKVLGKRLYAGSGVSRTQKETQIFCLDSDSGKVIWRHPAKLPVWGSPCVCGNRIFFGLGNGRFDKSADQPAGALLCVDIQTGKEIWCHDVDDAVLMTPAVDDDYVYFGSRDHHCYCVKQDSGQVQWQADMGSPVVARPIVEDNGIYMAASGGRVCRLGARDGQPIWTFDVAEYAQSKATLFASPASWLISPENRQRHLYVGAALESSFGSQAVLYCLEDSETRLYSRR